jgi:hypothetical protein
VLFYGDWAAAGGDGGGQLVAMDILVLIRELTFLMADFGFAAKKLVACNFCDLVDSPLTLHLRRMSNHVNQAPKKSARSRAI